MRDVTQEARLLRFELVQARAQPVEPLAEIAHVLGSIDLDGVGEVGGPHPSNRHVELADRPRDQHREEDRQRQRDRSGGEREIGPGLAPFGRGLLQPFDLASSR